MSNNYNKPNPVISALKVFFSVVLCFLLFVAVSATIMISVLRVDNIEEILENTDTDYMLNETFLFDDISTTIDLLPDFNPELDSDTLWGFFHDEAVVNELTKVIERYIAAAYQDDFNYHVTIEDAVALARRLENETLAHFGMKLTEEDYWFLSTGPGSIVPYDELTVYQQLGIDSTLPYGLFSNYTLYIALALCVLISFNLIFINRKTLTCAFNAVGIPVLLAGILMLLPGLLITNQSPLLGSALSVLVAALNGFAMLIIKYCYTAIVIGALFIVASIGVAIVLRVKRKKHGSRQPSDGQSSDGQSSDGQPSYAQPSYAQPSDEQPSDMQLPPDAQPSNEQPAQKKKLPIPLIAGFVINLVIIAAIIIMITTLLNIQAPEPIPLTPDSQISGTNTHTVTFIGNGGTWQGWEKNDLHTTRTVTVENGSSLGDKMVHVPAREGLVRFFSWVLPDGTEFSDSQPITGDITVYAAWIETTAGLRLELLTERLRNDIGDQNGKVEVEYAIHNLRDFIVSENLVIVVAPKTPGDEVIIETDDMLELYYDMTLQIMEGVTFISSWTYMGTSAVINDYGIRLNHRSTLINYGTLSAVLMQLTHTETKLINHGTLQIHDILFAAFLLSENNDTEPGGSVVNEGTIEAMDYSTLYFDGTESVNNGIINFINGGILHVINSAEADTFTNNGTITFQANNQGTPSEIHGDIINTGEITSAPDAAPIIDGRVINR